jgi:hypothetical protein
VILKVICILTNDTYAAINIRYSLVMSRNEKQQLNEIETAALFRKKIRPVLLICAFAGNHIYTTDSTAALVLGFETIIITVAKCLQY